MIPEIEYYKLASKDLKKLREMKYEMEMSKSQNTKKDLCITSEQLTEQWKKGELTEGYYYVKDGENMIAEYLDGYFYNNGEPMTSFSGGVDSVLAPVPSYEEWEQLQNWADFTKDYHELREKLEIAEYEKAELKELLKECRRYIDIWGYTDTHGNALLPQIDEVLK